MTSSLPHYHIPSQLQLSPGQQQQQQLIFSSNHLLDSHTYTDSSCGSIDLVVVVVYGGGACHGGYDGCAGVWQLTLSLRLGLMGPPMEATVLVLKKVEPWVEAAWVKVESGTEARAPLEATNV